jgi:hypothetical protein
MMHEPAVRDDDAAIPADRHPVHHGLVGGLLAGAPALECPALASWAPVPVRWMMVWCAIILAELTVFVGVATNRPG